MEHIQVGGTLIPGSLYIQRKADNIFRDRLQDLPFVMNVYGCRTMGKSSLYASHLQGLIDRGITPIDVDLKADLNAGLKNPTEWITALGKAIENHGHLAKDAVNVCLKTLGNDSTVAAALRCVLEQVVRIHKGPVILFLDETDIISNLPYRDEIIVGFRRIQSWQADSRNIDLRKISICFLGVSALHNLETSGGADVSSLGECIEMADFVNDAQTITGLSNALPKANPQVIRRILDLSGGQPFVTMDLLKRAQSLDCRTVEQINEMCVPLELSPKVEGGIQLFHQIDGAIASKAGSIHEAIKAYQGLLDMQPGVKSDVALDALRIQGLLRRNALNEFEIKGEMFERCFSKTWVDRMLSRLAQRHNQYHGGVSEAEKSICIINAGGTLGMLQRGDSVVPPKDTEEFMGYFPALNNIARSITFENFQPRDSINIFPHHWTSIAEYIYRRKDLRYDGFVVVHGTDTLTHTASAVAFALGPNLRFPVVFTGAQTTPDVPHGDAHVNLYRACEVAKQAIPEVVVSFGHFVFRAVRSQKRDDRHFDGFESPTYPPLAEITGEIAIRRELLRQCPDPPQDMVLRGSFERGILIVPQYPGLEPEFFTRLLDTEQGRPRGIIIQTLGAGNVTNAEPFTFIPLVEQATDLGIPVVVTSQYPPEPGSYTRYAPAQAPLKAGAIHAGNMTTAAAVAKFRWILAQVHQEPDWNTLEREERRQRIYQRLVVESVVGEF